MNQACKFIFVIIFKLTKLHLIFFIYCIYNPSQQKMTHFSVMLIQVDPAPTSNPYIKYLTAYILYHKPA